MKITPLGEPTAVRLAAVKVSGAEPSPQLTTTEPPLPAAVKRQEVVMVAPWLASVKVPSRTVPVVIPSMPVISVPLELVSWASRTVAVPGVRARGRAAQGRDDDVDRVGCLPRRTCGCRGPGRSGAPCRLASTPICWTASVTSAARRAVAPAADRQGRMLVGDGGQRVGVRVGRQHDHAGVLALDAGEVADGAGDRLIGDREAWP